MSVQTRHGGCQLWKQLGAIPDLSPTEMTPGSTAFLVGQNSPQVTRHPEKDHFNSGCDKAVDRSLPPDIPSPRRF